jgi:hypothetical protein
MGFTGNSIFVADRTRARRVSGPAVPAMSAARALKTKRALIAEPMLDWDCCHYPYRQILEMHNARADSAMETWNGRTCGLFFFFCCRSDRTFVKTEDVP